MCDAVCDAVCDGGREATAIDGVQMHVHRLYHKLVHGACGAFINLRTPSRAPQLSYGTPPACANSHSAGGTCAIILLSERRDYGVKGVSCHLNCTFTKPHSELLVILRGVWYYQSMHS